jgi:small-conductance mechanosensitive channel
VYLHEFGDDALVFRAFFWLRLDPGVGFLEVESDLRHRILNLFRDAGITIAFRQSDVHLAASEPLAVRVLPPQGTEPPPAA